MRVIQDSDEEIDEESLEEGFEPSAGADLETSNALFSDAKLALRDERGTGSTESLKKAIESAHRTHLQSPPAASATGTTQQHHGPCPLTEPEHRVKRRKTSPTSASNISPTLSSGARKSNKTYGRSRTLLADHLAQQPEVLQFGHGDTNGDRSWVFDGTLHQDYAHHNPVALFPDQSSTVANATATQERFFAGAMAASDQPPNSPYQPQGSVPWSEYLKSPTQYSHMPSDPSQGKEEPDTAQDAEESHTPPGSPSRSINFTTRSTCVTASICCPTSNISGDPTPNLSGKLADGVNSVKSEGKISEQVTSYQDQRLERSQDTDCIAVQEDAGIFVWPAGAVPSISKIPESAEPNSDDDLGLASVAKERYHPRPSRSRSTKVHESSFDYSVRPERAARKALRRSKTTGGIDSPELLSTPQKVKKICEMGFTPTKTLHALGRNNGDVNCTIDWLVANAGMDDHDELAPPRTARTKTKSSKARKKSTMGDCGTPSSNEPSAHVELPKMQTNGTLETEGTDLRCPTIQQDNQRAIPTNSPKVVISSPARKTTTRSPEAGILELQDPPSHPVESIEEGERGAEAQKIKTCDKLDNTTQGNSGQMSKPLPGEKKKRGRGRPRKEPNPLPVVDQAQTDYIDKDQDIKQKDDVKDGEPQPDSVDLNTTEANGKTEQAKAHSDAEERASLYRASPNAKAVLGAIGGAQTPGRQQAGPVATAQSPTSNGKVPYRVGLSRRARIAPLLKIMKK